MLYLMLPRPPTSTLFLHDALPIYAYATLADGGMRFWATPFVQVKNPGGKVDDVAQQGQQVIDQNNADLVTYALQGVVRYGTGYAAAIPPYVVAGKTGTANENVDAWFCGYTVQI